MTRTRLMSTPPRFVLSRLSRQLYLDFLTKARQRGFSVVRLRISCPARPGYHRAISHSGTMLISSLRIR